MIRVDLHTTKQLLHIIMKVQLQLTIIHHPTTQVAPRAVVTAARHQVQVGIDMTNINYLSPIYKAIYGNQMIVGGRSNLKKYLIMRLLGKVLPELQFEINQDLTFNPKQIKKVKSCKHR